MIASFFHRKFMFSHFLYACRFVNKQTSCNLKIPIDAAAGSQFARVMSWLLTSPCHHFSCVMNNMRHEPNTDAGKTQIILSVLTLTLIHYDYTSGILAQPAICTIKTYLICVRTLAFCRVFSLFCNLNQIISCMRGPLFLM